MGSYLHKTKHTLTNFVKPENIDNYIYIESIDEERFIKKNLRNLVIIEKDGKYEFEIDKNKPKPLSHKEKKQKEREENLLAYGNNPIIQLKQEDYKIIKCMETFLSSLPEEDKAKLPYDIDDLVFKRNNLRQSVNEEGGK